MLEIPPPGKCSAEVCCWEFVFRATPPRHSMFCMRSASNQSCVWCLLINAVFCSPSDVMTVLRQLQTFLLTQHSRDQTALQDYILRALLGVCQVSAFFVLGFHKNAADVDHGVLSLLCRVSNDASEILSGRYCIN